MRQNMDFVANDQVSELPAVVQANHYQFGPGERRTNHVVGSRTLLWGIRGVGQVRAQGSRLALDPGDIVVLPWGHDVTYHADSRDPFLVGGVHVVPWHDPDVAIEPRAAHGADDPLHDVVWRRDVPWPGLEDVRTVTGDLAQPVIQLGEVAVALFLDGDNDEDAMRALGVLLTRAARRLAREPTSSGLMSRELAAMTEYIRSHLHEHLTVRDVASVAGGSVSTAERVFRRETGMTPRAWIRTERMRMAVRLLRSSNLRISEVGARTGFRDPLYFSRAFRKAHGQSPRQYRAANPTL